MKTNEDIITDLNATRAIFCKPPVPVNDEKFAIECHRCEEIAELWVVVMRRNRQQFAASFDDMLGMMRDDLSRATRIDLCAIVDQWEDNFGLTADDFARLRPEIESWIVAKCWSMGMAR